MANSFSLRPNTVLSSFSDLTKTTTTPRNPFLRRTQFSGNSNHNPFFFRSTLTVARFGSDHLSLPEPDIAGWLFTRSESLVYTIADVSVSPESFLYTKPSNDWLSGATLYTDNVLEVLKKALSTLHIPYAYGFAIILLAVLVNAATFPLKKKLIEAWKTSKSLRPLVRAIRQRNSLDMDESLDEVNRLYEQFGINPWPGALRSLAWIAVTIGIYRKLSDVTDLGLLTEGFFWIPSLAGPTTIAAWQSGNGTSWLFPLADGQPQLGWIDTLAYLVLPVLVGISEYLGDMLRYQEEPKICKCPDCGGTTKFEIFSRLADVIWPVMFGFISLFVPSGLSLYWITHTILDDLQEDWLVKKGAKSQLKDISLIKPIQEKPTSYGPRSGDRFRQIKEREAKKQPREEERK